MSRCPFTDGPDPAAEQQFREEREAWRVTRHYPKPPAPRFTARNGTRQLWFENCTFWRRWALYNAQELRILQRDHQVVVEAWAEAQSTIEALHAEIEALRRGDAQ